jgi:hypothetical protein
LQSHPPGEAIISENLAAVAVSLVKAEALVEESHSEIRGTTILVAKDQEVKVKEAVNLERDHEAVMANLSRDNHRGEAQ